MLSAIIPDIINMSISKILTTTAGIGIFLLMIISSVHAASNQIDQYKLWRMINEYEAGNNLRPFIESPKVCMMAEKRLIETKTNWSHAGFYIHLNDFTYTRIGENLVKGYYSEQSTFQAWLNSPLHKKNLTSGYTYSCLRCEENRCVQIFASF